MRILYMTKENPTNALGHAPERARQFILELKNHGHEVQCVFPSDNDDGGLPAFRTYREKILGLFNSYHERRAGTAFSSALQKLAEHGKFDLIVAEELSSALLALKGKSKRTPPVIYIAHNVESDLYQQITGSKVIEKVRTSNLLRTEVWVLKQADLVFSFSVEDQKKLQILSGRNDIYLTRAGVNLPDSPALTVKNDKILFVGALDYFPNIQGLQWYAKNIHPLIKIKYGMIVVGRNPGSLVKAICDENNFELISSPPQLGSILRQGALEVVPLLSGSGTRGKILEAAAYGIPVIATTLGAQGLGFKDGQTIVIADTAEQFAAEVEKYLNNSNQRTDIANAALEYVQKFSYKAVVADFLSDLSKFK